MEEEGQQLVDCNHTKDEQQRQLTIREDDNGEGDREGKDLEKEGEDGKKIEEHNGEEDLEGDRDEEDLRDRDEEDLEEDNGEKDLEEDNDDGEIDDRHRKCGSNTKDGDETRAAYDGRVFATMAELKNVVGKTVLRKYVKDGLVRVDVFPGTEQHPHGLPASSFVGVKQQYGFWYNVEDLAAQIQKSRRLLASVLRRINDNHSDCLLKSLHLQPVPSSPLPHLDNAGNACDRCYHSDDNVRRALRILTRDDRIGESMLKEVVADVCQEMRERYRHRKNSETRCAKRKFGVLLDEDTLALLGYRHGNTSDMYALKRFLERRPDVFGPGDYGILSLPDPDHFPDTAKNVRKRQFRMTEDAYRRLYHLRL